ncbi:MAG TPA: ADP-ribosylglycohydrolase family protein [Abditibacteriaceae bacterium]|jgi:ADP-ribosylglycohydrolase
MSELHDAITGCILGAALGDALGLPLERLSRERGRKLFPHLERGPSFAFGRGFVSDDTEHLCLVASALAASAGDGAAFENKLVHGLRAWFLALPPGVGLATLRSCFKLCMGVSPQRSGVFSAGNGPAMRSAILGVCCDGDFDKLRDWNGRSTHLTHTDPKAEAGAFAIALAAWLASHDNLSCEPFLETLRAQLPKNTASEEMMQLARSAAESAARGESADVFAQSLGLEKGVSGYMFHTVPVVLQCALRPGDFAARVEEIVRCGGDADSTASILGGILGARGRSTLPAAWIARLGDWPRSVAWMETLASRLAQSREAHQRVAPPRLFFIPALARNIIFFAAILFHAARRLLPPY